MSGILQALLAGFGAVTDEYFKYVTMLLPGNGTNGAQNNTFLDSSTNNFTITRNGNTTQGTFSPYGSNWSNYFDGTGDYLTAPANAAFNFGTGAFTIEAWVYLSTVANNASLILNSSYNGNNGDWIIRVGAGGLAGKWEFTTWFGGTPYTASSNDNAVAGTWTHIAGVRNGNTFTLYINGVAQTTTATNTNSVGSSSLSTLICGDNSSGVLLTGYVSNLRVVKGTAVYTSNFTPSTSPLTAITNTSLLTCQSNRFIDNSTNAFTITVNGDTSVQRFSPFNPTAPYAAGTDGGSGYFDGTGDYLNTPTTGQFAPAGDFTIAVWYYPTTLSTNNIVIANYTADLTTDWQINVTSTGSIEFYTNGNPIRISGGSVKAGAWNYIVLARSGSTLTGYLNGTSIGTYTQSGTFGSATKTIWVGSRPFSGSPLPITGYISDVKLIDGSAVTTVPTAPQTATTGTNLLLSFTNAGILDNAEMNNLETVGNAQISTAQSKFGGGSIAFDGTGDYLTFPANNTLQFGTGDFTIEFWTYLNSVTGFQMFIDNRNSTSSTAAYITIYSSGTSLIFYTTGNDRITATSALSTGAWLHIAVSKSSGSTKMFVNGSQVGSTYSDANSYLAASTPQYIASRVSAADFNLNGYIDDLRITNGYARYTANFTAPTAPFPLS